MTLNRKRTTSTAEYEAYQAVGKCLDHARAHVRADCAKPTEEKNAEC